MALKKRHTIRRRSPPPPAFRRYTNLAAAIHLLQSRKITLLNPARWDDANDAYFMGEYKRLAGAETVLAKRPRRIIIGECSRMARTASA